MILVCSFYEVQASGPLAKFQIEYMIVCVCGLPRYTQTTVDY